MIQDTIKELIDNFKLGKEQEDYETVHSEIEKGIIFKGTNLIILICAILVASIGLNINSTAVIIGAMLISPLMGPINGIGYSVATYDFQLFKSAIQNLIFAVIVSLLTSALYFFISPINTAHSELLSRTRPTIYDVLIAVFGGIAGMLAINSKLKGNVIPGVAIATALMPPICTAGYGLATLQFNFLLGALYLFTINTVFIAVAAIIISRLLRFPIRSIVDSEEISRVNKIISIILIVVTIPSLIFGYRLVKDEEFLENTYKFIEEVSVQKNCFLLEKEVNPQSHTIRLIYSGYGVNDEAKNRIYQIATTHQIDTSKLEIVNGTDISILQQQREKMQSETEKLNQKLTVTMFSLQKKQHELDSIKSIPKIGNKILSEIIKIYPQITSCSYSNSYIYPDTILRPIVLFQTKKNINKTEQKKIVNWVRVRIKDEKTKVFFK